MAFQQQPSWHLAGAQAASMKSQLSTSVLLPLECIYPMAFVLVLILLLPIILSQCVPFLVQANLSSFKSMNQWIIPKLFLLLSANLRNLD